MQIFKKPNFKFMKFKLFAFGASFILIAAGLLNITTGKGITPGIDFGSNAEGYIRFSYANSLENIREGMARLEEFLAENFPGVAHAAS